MIPRQQPSAAPHRRAATSGLAHGDEPADAYLTPFRTEVSHACLQPARTAPSASRAAVSRAARLVRRPRGAAGGDGPGRLAGWPPEAVQDADLALCELYVNAWKHGGSPAPVVVVVVLADRTLRVSVSDDSPDLPEERPCSDPYELSGRGLHLVRTLTHRFGAAPRKAGKSIWFELDAAA
ncbi:ATP-binding protein [Kitasatospora indigofera]|uniref:ATP-binding protein n=1 Tax=Kitasatospora indigofera TaxID=67307 RepID=UPI00368E1B25